MRRRMYCQVLLVCLIALTLTACAREGTERTRDDDNELGEPTRVNGRLMGELTLTGTVATGQPAPLLRLCAQDNAEDELYPLCSLTDDVGDYRMLGLFNRRGLLSTDLTDAMGNAVTLFSFYDLTAAPGGTAVRANVNPTTDVISRVYLFTLQSQTATDCYDDPDCVSSLAAGLDPTLLSYIQSNVEALMGAAWPQQPYNPFTTRYVAETTDPLHRMHSRFYFEHSATPLGEPLLQVVTYDTRSGCSSEVVVEATYEELATDPELVTINGISGEELSNAGACALTGALPAAPFTVTVTASPPAGPAPLSTTVTVDVSNAPDNTLVSTSLLNPLGQEEAVWTDLERALTLDRAGVYRVVTTAQAPNDETNQGIQISVDGAALSPDQVTWGQAGSCYTPEQWLNNIENICVEKIDGSIATPASTATNCSVLMERPELTLSSGICSTEQQYDGALLGACVYMDRETRVFYYRNVGTVRAETAQQQHDRNQRVCELAEGTWTSLFP